VFQAWIDAGKMDPIDPVHLIFLLWGSTQHYADFASQICLFTGKSSLKKPTSRKPRTTSNASSSRAAA